MGHSKALTATLALLYALGCAAIQKSLREPGEKLKSFPDAVWEEYDCDTQKRPFLVVEKSDLVPNRLKPGGEFAHRLVYSMCPQHSTEVVRGRLQMSIRFKGALIVRDADFSYEIKPGRWVVDSFIALPENAEPGVYAYEVEFDSSQVDFEKSSTFVVGPP